MHLRKLKIENFRSIESIEVEFEKLVSVIIGPNAVGKTTILEAIRLAKAVLAPRTQNESGNTLNLLGATSPHAPQQIFAQALTKNTEKSTTINLKFDIENGEKLKIEGMKATIIDRLALTGSGIIFSNPVQAMNFLNSHQGQLAKQQADKIINDDFYNILKNKQIELNLKINYENSQMLSGNNLNNIIFSVLEQGLPPTQSLFSYFPADRAMPSGEQQVQLGLADAIQQLESYNSQPQLKFARLKNTIFSTIVSEKDGREDIERNFKRIFDRILKGRELGQIGVNQLGMLSIPIRDTESEIEFEIDGLSSGEKGLILTFLLIAKTISENGMILLDEPELHLNPAVCRDLLQFFIDEYAKPKNIQAIICSHSTEILAGVFEREEHCTLFHLRNGALLAKVRRHDNTEIREALTLLGTSEIETLLYRGAVFVEGADDLELLRAGFDDIFRRYKMNDLGGRGSIEKDIQTLQKNEKNNEINGKYYFIFDNDGRQTNLKNSASVKILQLPVYCIENFLIDCNIITDLTRDKNISRKQISSVTDAEKRIKKIALNQLDAACARLAFKELNLEEIGFHISFKNKGIDDIIPLLKHQIENIEEILQKQNGSFCKNFREIFDNKFREEGEKWDSEWMKLCNGKLLFENIHKEGIFFCSPLVFKKEIMRKMKYEKNKDWDKMRELFTELLDEKT